MKRRFFSLSVLALLVAAGCGGGGGGSTPAGGTRAQTGTLAVRMADAPPSSGPTISRVDITIGRVEAHVDGQWTSVAGVPQSFNLLDLVTDDRALGSAGLPAGTYHQVRFFPTAATVTDTEGTHPLDIGGADRTGVKVNVDYTIRPDEITTVLLDFNVAKSVRRLGNGSYRLQPVIPAVVKTLSGTITGTVTDAAGTPVAGASVSATYLSGNAYPIGTEVNTSTSREPDGAFKVWALLPGVYTLTTTFIDPTTGAVSTVTRPGVVVTANQNADAGALALVSPVAPSPIPVP